MSLENPPSPHIASPLEKAIELATRFHRGQRDKQGNDYIQHPLRMMMLSEDPRVQQAAVLHDVLEDTAATLQDLIEAGVDLEACEAVQLLTHQREMSYADYIVLLQRNPIARAAKLLDLQDNYRLDRVAYREGYEHEDRARIEKYILTYQFLTDRLDEETYRRRMALLVSSQ